MRKLLVWCGAAVAVSVACPRAARASNVMEFPDNGSEQMARGGAWVARASDPLATFFNPAGLAGQRSGLTLQANISMQHTCFTRVQSGYDTTAEPLADPTTGEFPQVCNTVKPFPNPQLAAVLRLTDRVGLGFAVLGPSAVGAGDWPSFVDGKPAPQRYLLMEGNLFQINPTIGIGAEVVDNLRLGAAFTWGIFKAKFTNAAPALNQDRQNPEDNDVANTLIVSDYFVPGFSLGALYSATENIDVAGWYKWSDAIRASGDVYTQAGYFSKANARGDSSGIVDGDTSERDCHLGNGSEVCGGGKNASLKVVWPMEAKLGFRFHGPRPGFGRERSAARREHLRDPLLQDFWDAEVDFTWANNSAVDALQVRFPGNGDGDGVIPVNGVAGGTIPPNADVPRHYKDVFGVRAGGDVNILPDQFALRGGVFYESRGQDVHYQNVDFMGGARFGLSGGLTLRVHTQKDQIEDRYRPAIEFHLGYMHMFAATQKDDDPYGTGLAATAGSACNPAGNAQPGDTCKDGKPKYRTNWPVNLGTITNALNVINVGATYRF